MENEDEREDNSQFKTFVSNVITIINALLICHRHKHSSNHYSDINRFRSKVQVLYRDVSEYDRRQDFDGLLAMRSSLRPTPWTRTTNNFDLASDIIESLLLSVDINRFATFRLHFVELLDVDSKRVSEFIVISTDELNDFASGNDTESSKYDRHWNILVDRVVLEVDFVVLREDIGFRLPLVS